MAGDFTIPAITIFSPNTVILSGQVNTNNSAIRTAHNNAFNATTGHQHTGATGDAPLIPATSVVFANFPVNPEVKSAAPGTGKAILSYGSSNNNRTVTIPDSGANASFLMTEGAQTINGDKTFTANRLKVGGGGAGIASLQNANTANNRTIILPDTGSSTELVAVEGTQTINGTKTFSSEIVLPDVDPPGAANRVNRNGIVKGWAQLSSTGVLGGNYNVQSAAREATGVYQVDWDRDFSGTYSVSGMAETPANFLTIFAISSALTEYRSEPDGGGPIDSNTRIMAIGAQ